MLFTNWDETYNPRKIMLSHEHVDSVADDVLLRNIVQGCTDCFALFHRYCREVFSVSYRITKSPSHLAITTEARQFPMTFTDVLAISIN